MTPLTALNPSLPPAEVKSQPERARILDRSVSQLVADTDYVNSPLLETQQKWKNYGGLKTQEEKAVVMNYGDAGQEKTWVDLRSANSYNDGPRVITCVFNSEWRQRIQLLNKNDTDKPITFSGTVRGDLTQGGVPILENCSIK